MTQGWCDLPYRVVTPLPVRYSEVLGFTEEEERRVHGVLWVVDEMAAARVCPPSLLLEALRAWRDDPTVFLPKHEISKRLDSLAQTTRDH